MKELLEGNPLWVTLATNLLIIVFLIGGFWYLTPQKIEANARAIQENSNQIQKLQMQIQANSLSITEIQGRYVSNEDLSAYITRPILDDLRDLIEQIQASQDQRLNRIESRLDYIIERQTQQD